ncbi:MAG: HD-GYP domain-containing protein [Lachnospiraceae bacterium]|nr:HD-GYP domain-containing protein [Lachnospiraceae bacterium]
MYLMFTVFMVLTMRSDVKDLLSDHPFWQMILNRSGDVSIFVGMTLFYFLIVKPLAKLTDRPFETSWRIFVIPPAVFCVVYATVALGILTFLNEGQLVIIDFFSILIMFLFIWAFHVIIKNINATGEAIKARDEVKTLSVEVMEALAHTIDAKDEYTKGHSVRVAKYARMIAERLGLSEMECENIYYMGLLHDIGKIGVPNEIINSTSKLTDEEYDVIKTHPVVGYDILAEIKSRPDLSIGARWHHERVDGKGYPDKKPGEGIPLQARIIAVADSYDAMTSNRSYRHYLPQEKVRSEIEQNAGTQFDPQIAKVMLAIIDEDTEYTMHE